MKVPLHERERERESSVTLSYYNVIMSNTPTTERFQQKQFY